MAKNKSEDENNNVTYQGKSVDPNIQKKVEEYMELGSSNTSSAGDDIDEDNTDKSPKIKKNKAKRINVSHHDEESGAGTAPLLPTDKLPGALKDDEAKNNDKEDENKDNLDGDDNNEKTEDKPKVEPKKSDKSKDEAKPENTKDEENEESDDENPVGLKAKEDEGESDKKAPKDEDDGSKTEQKIGKNEDDGSPEKKDDSVDLSDETDAQESDGEDGDESAKRSNEEEINLYENEPDKLVGPAGALWAKYKDKTVDDVDNEQETTPSTDDTKTEEAIKEIIAEDSDKVLGIEDDGRKQTKPIKTSEPKSRKSVGSLLKAWFKNPFSRNSTIALAILLLIILSIIPATRYFILNTAGVRVSTSMKILDSKTTLPLKNVEVKIDSKSAKTDIDGNVSLTGVKLGRQEMIITKPAFAEIKRNVTLGWGSNPLGDFEIEPVGSQYKFFLTDFLSNKPVTEGELVYEESNARFSEQGEAIITIPDVSEEKIKIQVIAEDYRTEEVEVSTVNKQDQYAVKLVPSEPHVFFTKRTGKVDLFKVDVDGKNEELLLAGSGIEKEDSLGIAPHPDRQVAAFSSSRENVRNSDGFLLNTLQIIDISTKEIKKVAQSERIQIIDWIGDKLIYVKIAEGASATNTERHRLVSYDSNSGEEVELASTNYFNDVMSVNGAVYYSPALYKVNGSVGLFKINPDGSDKKTVFNKEVWNIFRTSYDKASLSVGRDWYELNLSDDKLTKVGGAPAVLKSRLYVDSPDRNLSLWIDERDGKTALIAYDKEKNEDKVLISESGIKTPLRWLDDRHVVYRIETGQETADYILSLGGGVSEKIVDVTSSYGIDRWYYF